MNGIGLLENDLRIGLRLWSTTAGQKDGPMNSLNLRHSMSSICVQYAANGKGLCFWAPECLNICCWGGGNDGSKMESVVKLQEVYKLSLMNKQQHQAED